LPDEGLDYEIHWDSREFLEDTVEAQQYHFTYLRFMVVLQVEEDHLLVEQWSISAAATSCMLKHLE